MSDIDQMTLAELNVLSARLYDDFYALKDKIKKVDRLRNAKMQEELAHKALEVAQLQLDQAQKAQQLVVVPDSIESDEVVHTDVPKWQKWLSEILNRK